MSNDRAANPRHYDVAIAGGGLVGASLACALEPLGLKVAVLEAIAPRASTPPSFDDRTLALNHASCRILEGLGLWPDIESSATPIRRVIVTELDRPGRVELDPAEMGADVMVRGLRAVVDYEFEFQLNGMNSKLNPAVESVFLMADARYQSISSSLVKEIAMFGGDISPFVPEAIARQTTERMADRAK